MSDWSIRPAQPGDEASILGLIRSLARYEQLEHEVEATPELIADALFGETPSAEALVAHVGEQPVGFALFFHNFSTFLGRKGLYLEDLYVEPSARGQGIGRALLRALARIALERGCGRMEWSVLDWNTPAIEFYQTLGAVPMSDWTVNRLDQTAMQTLAKAP